MSGCNVELYLMGEGIGMMHWTEAEELAALVLGIDPDKTNSHELEEKIADKFDVDMETFQRIADALVPFTVKATTALGGAVCQGYVHECSFIYRREV
jgi:hypothetical protein